MTPEKPVPNEKTLQHFGMIVGGIILLISLWPFLHHLVAVAFNHSWFRLFLGLFGLGLIWFALSHPKDLETPYEYWMIVGDKLGWFNTRLILGIIFYGLITPLGFIMRTLGHDPLRLKTMPNETTFKEPMKQRNKDHFEKQF